MDTLEFDISFLSEKLSENPHSPLFARLADIYLSNKQETEALKLCERGTAAYPSYTTGYIILGKVYFALKEYTKAHAAFQQAVRLNPFNKVARKLLANTFRKEHETTQGVVTENTATKIPATDIEENAQLSFSKPFLSFDEYCAKHNDKKVTTQKISLDEYLGLKSLMIDTKSSNEIDILTEKLTNAQRITPDENFHTSSSHPEEKLSEVNIITPTLAEIYASQKKYDAAINAYQLLITSQPDQKEKFEERIRELEKKTDSGE